MKRSLILSLVVAVVLGIPTYADSPPDHSFLLGLWVNINYPSGSIPYFYIYLDQNRELVINTWGQCTPTPCDWGSVPCIDYSDDIGNPLATGFMAFYDFGWKETWMAGTQFDYPEFPLLEVFDFHFYFDPRYDRWNSDIYIRVDLKE